MTSEVSRDGVERALRDASRCAIADNGFTLRVMQRLPVQPRRAQSWLKPALVVGSALLGGALAYAFAPAGTSLVQGFLDLARARLTPAAITGLALCGTLMVSALVVGNEWGSDSN